MNNDCCLAPWFSIYIGKRYVKPCCLWSTSIAPEKHLWESLEDIENMWNSEDMKNIRQNFLKGDVPKQCANCLKRIISRKIWLDKKIGEHVDEERIILEPPLKPLQADFQLGSKCNLQCRTCGSWGSCNWTEDDAKLNEINPAFNRQSLPEYSLDVSKFKDCKEMFSDLVRFDFKGGEPMIQNSMIEMIENLVEWGNAPNIILAYVTNGSFINEKIVKLWSDFKEVRLIISVDGTYELFSYIRGYAFEKLVKNLQIYDQIENLKGLYNVTVSVYNLLDIAKINDWLMTRTFKRFPCLTSGSQVGFDTNVMNPSYLDVTILPKKYKQLALDDTKKYNHSNILPFAKWLESILDIPPNKEQLKLFVSFTKYMDKKKGTDFLSIKPEYKELFEEYS